MLVPRLLALLGCALSLPSQVSASSSNTTYKWQKTSLSPTINIIYPAFGEAQSGDYTALGTFTSGGLSGLYYSLSISLLCPNGTTLSIVSAYNVNITDPSFNPSAPYRCGDVNGADQQTGTTGFMEHLFMTDEGVYSATWNFTYTFPEKVDTSGEAIEGAMCTGVTTSETELLSRNFTVLGTLTATKNLGEPWETETASFSVQPTGDIYTLVPAPGAGLRAASVSLGWVISAIGGSIGLLLV